MGFMLSYQQQSPNFLQDPARETMYYFWFVYLSGRVKIQLLFACPVKWRSVHSFDIACSCWILRRIFLALCSIWILAMLLRKMKNIFNLMCISCIFVPWALCSCSILHILPIDNLINATIVQWVFIVKILAILQWF